MKYSLAYGEFRRAPGRPRGKFVQVEPRMSLTAANADEWLPAAVGTEALVALAIAQVIIREGLLKNTPSPADVPDLGAEGLFAGSLETTSQSASTAERLQAYAPEKTESITGIPSDKVIRIAREFATSQASLAIGCGSELIEQVAKGQASLKKIEAIHFLNKLVSNENKPGGVLLATGGDFDPLARWRNRERKGWLPLTNRRLRGQDMSAMLIHQANPVYTSSRLADLMSAVPFIVTFSSFMDETAQLADLILPDHSYLESWDIHARTGPVVNLTQPVVHPEFNTRQTADLLIALIRELGGEPPFETAEEFVKQAASDLTKARGSISADNADDFWKGFVERGVWVGEPQAGKEINKESRGRPALTAEVLNELGDLVPQHNGGEGHNLMLLTYDHAALGPGAEANLPWLQEMPDPMTSVMWGSWVEINPQTAVSLGIADGDLVEVETAGGSLRVPALIYPAIRPDVIAIPLGQGHTALGRYSNGRGVNAAALNPAAGLETSVAVRAKVTRLGSQAQLIRFGTMLPERPHTKR